MFLCLVRELGIEVEVNRKFDWLTNRITPSEEALWRIFIALDGDPEGMQSKRSCRLTPDGFLPEYECIIEFDELQHFTAFRSQAFEHYPEDVHLGFDIDTYRSWCDQHAISALKKGASGYRKRKPEFPFDGGRAAQRALFDACRDLLPPWHGLKPTIRISEFELPSLLHDRKTATDEVRIALGGHLLTGARSPRRLSSMPTCRHATITSYAHLADDLLVEAAEHVGGIITEAIAGRITSY